MHPARPGRHVPRPRAAARRGPADDRRGPPCLEKLTALRHLPAVTGLLISGDFTSAELHAALRDRPWTNLVLQRNSRLTDLSFLADCAGTLEALSLIARPAVPDLAPLAALPAPRIVDLDMSHVPDTALAAVASKKLFFLRLSRRAAERLSQLPALPELHSLGIEDSELLEVDSLDGWTELRQITVVTHLPVRPLLAALRRAPQVSDVRLTLASLTECSDEQPVPSLTDLALSSVTDMLGLETAPRPSPPWSG